MGIRKGETYRRIKIYYGEVLIAAIEQADKECGSCGCDLDPLYKRTLELIL